MRQWCGFVIGLGCLTPVLAVAENPQPTAAKDTQLTPLNKEETVLLDKPGKRLLLKGEVCLREGLLEMLVCLKGTKEHEAIVSVKTKAQTVHAGLLALGAESGEPVQFLPKYRPPTGDKVAIFLSWELPPGKIHRVPAQTWVRNSTRRYYLRKLDKFAVEASLLEKTELRWHEKQKELLWYGPMSAEVRDDLLKLWDDKAYQAAIRSFHADSQTRELKAEWVFAGSGFYTDPQTNERLYQAEGGDLICVANFATATLDLAIESSATNDDLMYEAFTERIPPIGTPITIELLPQRAKDKPVVPPTGK